MLAQAQQYLNQSVWLGVFPGIAIFLAALCFNLLGDGITDALNPRGRR
jgi:ABC-type dipeptide/oligopeptide/nickel transport system permease subunit